MGNTDIAASNSLISRLNIFETNAFSLKRIAKH